MNYISIRKWLTVYITSYHHMFEYYSPEVFLPGILYCVFRFSLPSVLPFSLFTYTNMQFGKVSVAFVSICLVVVGNASPAVLIDRQSTVRIMALGDSITGSPVGSPLVMKKMELTSFKGLLARLLVAKTSASWH